MCFRMCRSLALRYCWASGFWRWWSAPGLGGAESKLPAELAWEAVCWYNRIDMAKVCQVTGKKPMSGNRVSHANNKTKRRFEPNLKEQRFWVPSENRFVKLKVSAKGMKIIDKQGIEQVLRDMKARGESAR